MSELKAFLLAIVTFVVAVLVCWLTYKNIDFDYINTILLLLLIVDMYKRDGEKKEE